jgi:hypothetical protein
MLDRLSDQVAQQPRRILDFSRPRLTAATGALDLLDFWYGITGPNTLHINGGKVPIVGANISVAAVDVDCPGTDTGARYAYLEVSVAEATASIAAVASSTEPVSEVGIARRVLYELHKSSGSIVIDAIRITDPWILPVLAE